MSTTTTEPACSGAHAPQLERSPRDATKSTRAATQRNRYINIKKKKRKKRKKERSCIWQSRKGSNTLKRGKMDLDGEEKGESSVGYTNN